ncbi:MAG TPA: tetratricopeptide repeat protein [Archangium sp.]|uniref:tetratricopeptide repeat protein n=1 Tax=Archangium sp. TaxID=1872627 RepID=UPI002E336E46|nr:tetratricopeptide repeat protein [Archangium sp.]HEX5750879.1 tetratricopeptide repeat protein [Archangium sp.]
MSDLPSSQWLHYARVQISRGENRGALETLRRALAEDPEDSEAHALLSLVLLALKRPHAAEHEAGLALSLEALLPLAHYAAASVAMARRRFQDAEQHLTHLLELEPDDTPNLLLQARFLELTGKKERKREVLQRAHSLNPNDPATLVALGWDALERGDVKHALQWARDALSAQPELQDGLVLMGQVYLRQGRIEDAREHALWALRQDATDEGSLRLLASIKARQSRLLGVWWRYAMFMGSLGDGKSTLVLLGAYVAYRFATLAAEDLGQPGLAGIIQLVWLGLALYTWVGPALFQRMVRQELDSVRLDPRF